MKLLLASSSPYRRQLLARLGLPFNSDAPAIDESPQLGEDPETLVLRLAKTKARALQHRHSEATIIGSDQVASLAGEILTKPGHYLRAFRQLQTQSGKAVEFHTGLCVLHGPTNEIRLDNIVTRVEFRQLRAREIDFYLRAEQPYNCAGSFMAEGLGIALFRSLHSDDPTALIGLPLIRLGDFLQDFGWSLLDQLPLLDPLPEQ